MEAPHVNGPHDNPEPVVIGSPEFWEHLKKDLAAMEGWAQSGNHDHSMSKGEDDEFWAMCGRVNAAVAALEAQALALPMLDMSKPHVFSLRVPNRVPLSEVKPVAQQVSDTLRKFNPNHQLFVLREGWDLSTVGSMDPEKWGLQVGPVYTCGHCHDMGQIWSVTDRIYVGCPFCRSQEG